MIAKFAKGEVLEGPKGILLKILRELRVLRGVINGDLAVMK